MSTTHQNVRLTLELAREVGFIQAFTSYPVEHSQDTDTQLVHINVGDLFAEERRDVLVSLRLPSVTEEGPHTLGWFRERGFSILARCSEELPRLSLIVDRHPDVSTDACRRHPQVQRQWNRHIATDALEVAQTKARGGNLDEARKLLEKAREALSDSPLTAQGDTVSLGLLTDLNDCLSDLRHEQTYHDSGSKKMACMKGSHGKQRACFGQGFSEGYSNTQMMDMKAMFKNNCK